MLTIDDYMDAAKKRHGIPSDRQLAFRLGATAATSCQWRTKRNWPGESLMRKLAQLAGIDEELALLDLETWRSDEESGRIFQRIRDRLVKLKEAAAAIFIGSTIGLSTLSAPHHANAEQYMINSTSVKQTYTLCDKWIWNIGAWTGRRNLLSGRGPPPPTPAPSRCPRARPSWSAPGVR